MNLFQGAASAIIGGAVAAITAWFVVIATKKHDRRIATESAARDALLEIIQTCVLLVAEVREFNRKNVPTILSRQNRNSLFLIHVRLARNLYSVTPLITSLDEDLASKIRQIGGDIGANLPDHSRRCRKENLVRAASLTIELQDTIAEWLAKESRHSG